ncbi:MAG: acyl carrier protein [Candidatus Organicella extenuata]|jgi:acyl carrier protein|uniref:Acyl carrier protein n=1 Tax=Candidatus Organicella extenuata TaxID=2841811 RepID=A0AA51GEK3_9BACT|nr:MAG: acyl carrier protein [Candidatus Organicella extenuata]
MERSSIEYKVKKIVANQLSVTEDNIKIESSFIGDLGADSLDTVELVISLEEEFKDLIGGEISEEDASGLKTVGDVVNYIEKKLV